MTLGIVSTGCSDFENGPEICDRPATPVPIEYTAGVIQNGIYRTGDWCGELMYFPGGAYYQIDHNLGVIPERWEFYLSFNRNGLKRWGGRSLTQAAGNQVQVESVDEKTITVLNGTCSSYWLIGVIDSGLDHVDAGTEDDTANWASCDPDSG